MKFHWSSLAINQRRVLKNTTSTLHSAIYVPKDAICSNLHCSLWLRIYNFIIFIQLGTENKKTFLPASLGLSSLMDSKPLINGNNAKANFSDRRSSLIWQGMCIQILFVPWPALTQSSNWTQMHWQGDFYLNDKMHFLMPHPSAGKWLKCLD